MLAALVGFLPIGPAIAGVLLAVAAAERPPIAATAPVAGAPSPAAREVDGQRGGRCPATSPRVRVALVADTVRARDSTAHVWLCLSGPSAGRSSAASLRVAITYDSAALRVRPGTPAAGLVANARMAGTIQVAGASPQGLPTGALDDFTVSLTTRGRLAPMRLDVVEMSDARGANMTGRAQVVSLGSPECAAHAESSVYVTALSPTGAEVGEIATLTISGCGFDATRNVITFGDMTIPNVPSSASGTQLQIRVPQEIASRSEVPPTPVAPGPYRVSVRTSVRTSNVLVFTLR